MKKRLVLAGCKDTHRTNWMRATGTEGAVMVGEMGEEDVVLLVLMGQTGELEHQELIPGVQPLREGPWTRYMVSKVAGSVPVPTTVEIELR